MIENEEMRKDKARIRRGKQEVKGEKEEQS